MFSSYNPITGQEVTRVIPNRPVRPRSGYRNRTTHNPINHEPKSEPAMSQPQRARGRRHTKPATTNNTRDIIQGKAKPEPHNTAPRSTIRTNASTYNVFHDKTENTPNLLRERFGGGKGRGMRNVSQSEMKKVMDRQGNTDRTPAQVRKLQEKERPSQRRGGTKTAKRITSAVPQEPEMPAAGGRVAPKARGKAAANSENRYTPARKSNQSSFDVIKGTTADGKEIQSPFRVVYGGQLVEVKRRKPAQRTAGSKALPGTRARSESRKARVTDRKHRMEKSHDIISNVALSPEQVSKAVETDMAAVFGRSRKARVDRSAVDKKAAGAVPGRDRPRSARKHLHDRGRTSQDMDLFQRSSLGSRAKRTPAPTTTKSPIGGGKKTFSVQSVHRSQWSIGQASGSKPNPDLKVKSGGEKRLRGRKHVTSTAVADSGTVLPQNAKFRDPRKDPPRRVSNRLKRPELKPRAWTFDNP